MFSRMQKSYLFACCSLFSATCLALEPETEHQRVPTEELIEGIKSSDGRWFEVEVIIFAQERKQELREKFEQEVQGLAPKRHWDLVSQYLQPDINQLLNSLPECWLDKKPEAIAEKLLNEQGKDVKSAAFFQHWQEYQNLITTNWQFTNELCLTPSETQTGYWQTFEPVNYLSADENKQYYQDIPVQEVPKQIAGGDFDDYHSVYLISPDNLQLHDEYEKLRTNRNTRPLLHIGWRQPGLSKRRSMPFLIKAGKNYTEDFYYQGAAKPQNTTEPEPVTDETEATQLADPFLIANQTTVVDEFMQKLSAGAVVDTKSNQLIMPEVDSFPEETWELDGYIQVHLNHYLFLNSKLNYRKRVTEQIDASLYVSGDESLVVDNPIETEVTGDTDNAVLISAITKEPELNAIEKENANLVDVEYLQVFPFAQQRRTYSGDLHYLDHPQIGLLFQIRKYRH